MQVQVSTDSHTDVASDDVAGQIEGGLARFADRLTRVEAHLTDQNGPKGGVDTRCVLEARPAGHQPVAVTHTAAGPDEAVDGAIDRMVKLLTSTFGKLDDPRAGPSASGLPT